MQVHSINSINPFDIMDEIVGLLSEGKFNPSNNLPTSIASNGFPYCDLYVNKKDSSWNLEVVVTGYDKDEVTIDYADNYFTVNLDGSKTEASEDRAYIKKGISKKSGSARIFIDSTKYSINDTEVEWNKKPGILSIRVPVDKRYVAPKSFSLSPDKASKKPAATTKKS